MQITSRLISIRILVLLAASLLGNPLLSAELEVDAPLPPVEAAATMVVPRGFQVTLFAGEPDVMQPIGFCIDDRGRLWVAEAYNYPNHGTEPGDRIVILEDTDHDGRFDKRTIFYDQLNYVTGIEVGFGGAWVMSPPFFYFIPDRDGDDRPDDKPQVLLDGFGNHSNSHNLANGFAWGPDGWLYGTHGRTNWSMIGKRGTSDDRRVRFDGGVYRYHPVRHIWEPFADGTTNPWGIDWDDYGQGFVCNCVNPHLFHVIQGAHYEPWRNRESSQYAYERINTIADHLHFVGQFNVRDGLGTQAEDEAGGGHAHCGTMIYLGDSWPAEYRNTVFMNNIHGRRINNDILRRAGSGYIASHGRDLMLSKDPWYMGVTLQYGPDGSVFASDWSDTGECHSVKNTRRHTGRIYKIAYGKPSPPTILLGQLSDLELVELQLHRNEWFVRHARRLLQEHYAAGHNMSEVHAALHRMFAAQPDVPRKLRALWTLHVTGGIDDSFLISQLSHDSEYVRSWAIQLLCEDKQVSAEALQRFNELAAADPSPFVRLHLASALQRLGSDQRWSIAESLIRKSEDASDQNLPLMLWYGIEPLVNADLERFIELASVAEIPIVRRHIGRRAVDTAQPEVGIERLVKWLNQPRSDVAQLDVLTGMLQGLEGRRTLPMPRTWPDVYAKLERSSHSGVRESAVQLALIFNDPAALKYLRRVAADTEAEPQARNQALALLLSKKVPDLAPFLLEQIKDADTRHQALRGLAEYDHSGTVESVLELYPTFDAAAKQDALQTLASRAPWGMALMVAVETNRIPRTDLTAFTARQLTRLGDPKLTARVETLWGNVRSTPLDKARLIGSYKRLLTPESLQRADRVAGRVLFQKTCANCHQLFDAGEKIGPDITGSQRTNLDYLLENLIDPSGSVAKDYQMDVIETVSGRVITGLVIAETAAAVTVQTVNEKLVVPINEIETRTKSPVSLMPEGMLKELTTDQVRQLIAYLMNASQVPLPETGGQ